MSDACDQFVMEDQSCDCFDMVEYIQSFDMGINFLLGPPTPSEVIFTPHVSEDGTLSWTNDGGLPNPDPVNIMGPPGESPVQSVNGKTGAVVLTSVDIGLGNVANERQYSANNPPPYPVTSVAGKVGAISLLPSDVGLGSVANERQYSAQNPPPYPVTSVNGKTDTVVLAAADVGALSDSVEIKTIHIEVPYTAPASGNASANIKQAIDAQMPTGYRFLAYSTYSTNYQRVFIINLQYEDSNFSLFLSSMNTSSVSATFECDVLVTNLQE